MASKASPLIDTNHRSFHGCVSGPLAVSRLKAVEEDCYLVRYSENQSKYILTVLKKGLGQDRDNDLVKDFEILIVCEGIKCKINGLKKTFKTLDDMLMYYETTPIHPSVTSLGKCCPSPRHKQIKAKRALTESQISQMSPNQTLTCFNKQKEELEKRIEDMERLQSAEKSCIIL